MIDKGILYKIFIIPLLLIPLVCPFHISAGTVSGGAPIIGVNVYVIDYEYGKVPVQGTVTLETDMTRWQCVSGSSSRCAVWQSQNTSDVVQNEISGTITYSNGSYSAYLYEFDFVFDDDYVGYVRFSSQITAGSGNIYYVNGSHLTITSTTLINSFTITEYQLASKSDGIMWLFPIESFSAINYCLNQNMEQVGLDSFGDYMFPIFQTKAGDVVADQYISIYGTQKFVWIFYVDWNPNNETRLKNHFTFTDINIENIQILQLVGSGSIVKVTMGITSGVNSQGSKPIIAKDSFKYMPIYSQRTTDFQFNNNSLEFALKFGLSNTLLDNVQKIANGTTNSNQDANNLETVSDDISSSSDDLIQSENSFNNSMNSNLQQIDTNINIGNLGSKFLASADWVRMQFNTLTNGTPFGSVLSFSLLLGLALVLVGRIRK